MPTNRTRRVVTGVALAFAGVTSVMAQYIPNEMITEEGMKAETACRAELEKWPNRKFGPPPACRTMNYWIKLGQERGMMIWVDPVE